MSNGPKQSRAAGSVGDLSPAGPAEPNARIDIAREIFIRQMVSAGSLQKTPEHVAEQALAAADAFLAIANRGA